MNKYANFYALVRRIPKGRVATYGQLAKLSGIKNPRLIGSLLHKNPDPVQVPCHRVVNSRGKLALKYAFGGVKVQSEKLKREGLVVIGDRVNLKQYLWES